MTIGFDEEGPNALRFLTAAPELEGETLTPPVFDGESARWDGLVLTRTVQRDRDGGLSVTLRLRNERTGPVAVRRLIPFRISDSAALPGGGGPSWRVFRMARQKNDIPGFFNPAIADEARSDALFDSSEITAGGGISGQDGTGTPDPMMQRFEADPAMIVRASPRHPPLLIGFIGQDRHLNAVTLTADGDGAVTGLEAAAVFDGAELAPGAAIETHALVVRADADTASLLEGLIDQVAALYRVAPPPARRPSVYCSWYFYGRDFGQDDLRENLDALRRRPIPCDVILIDNGWMDRFGDWNPNERFPSGMADAAERISRAGYTPGIWTAPFVMAPDAAILKTFPDLVLRHRAGEPCIFNCVEGPCRILDPTAPHAPVYLQRLFDRLTQFGFRYHKLDFVRAVLLYPDARFHDPARNRAQACRQGLSLIRAALSTEGTLEVCGGLFEGSAGLADIVRSGSDVRGHWDDPARLSRYRLRIQQNLYRNGYNRLWHTDPDALQLRRRSTPFRGNVKAGHLSMGTFSDDEAFTIVVNQFLGGGITGFSERLSDLDDDRLDLLRHVIPPLGPPARVLDMETAPGCPERFLTAFPVPGNGLDPWWILTLANWSDQPREQTVRPAAVLPAAALGARIVGFEFREQRFLGVLRRDAALTLTLPPHGVRMIRWTPWDGRRPVLAGTDQHLSQGMELAAWRVEPDGAIRARPIAGWRRPIGLTVLYPDRECTPERLRIEPAG